MTTKFMGTNNQFPWLCTKPRSELGRSVIKVQVRQYLCMLNDRLDGVDRKWTKP